MRNTILYLFFLLLVLASCHHGGTESTKTAHENPNSLSIKLTNGHWFSGTAFDQRTVWVSNGILHFDVVDTEPDTIIDLQGKYVIPPFAEAHNHNLESEYQIEERINSYLDNGVFYVKLLSSIKKRIDPLMHYYNKPQGLEVSMAHAPLTGSGGHPVALRKRFLQFGYFNGLFNTLEDIESHGYFTIDDQEDLERKWTEILSFEPDFIKIMLLYSEEYEERKDDTTYFGNKGLDPALVPHIVQKAHQHDLRISTHVETAHDFRIAVESGVDEIAHLPEIDNGALIARKDARLAKSRGTVVTTTVSLITKKREEPNYNDLVQNIRANLQILKEEGVTMAIGSDMYNDNSVEEFQFLYDLGVFSNLELLKMWCEHAAMTTLPDRKIGLLKEGYEASFLVLDSNPLNEDIRAINEAIVLKVKQGEILE